MSLRDRFPIFQTKTFINSCSKGALSTDVRAAYEDYLHDWESIGSPWELWVHKLEQTRAAFADLLHAENHEIAIATSTSQAVSALASAFDYSGGRNRILLSDFDFPGVAQVWHAQEKRGAQIVHLPASGHQIPLRHFEELIDDRTALVAFAHVCYRNGVKQDAQAIIDIAHKKGVPVLMDCYQSAGTLPIDVKKLKVDFLVGGTLKYLLGSIGTAFLYVRSDWVPQLTPTDSGWFAQDNIFAMDIYHNVPARSARRFESGTPNVPDLYATLAGLKIIAEVGIETIEKEVQALTGAIKEGAMRRGYALATPADADKHGPMIAIKGQRVDKLMKWLEEQEGVIISQRDGNLRISPHFYNEQSDVDRLFDVLAKYKHLLI